MIEQLYNLFLQTEVIDWDVPDHIRLCKNGSGAIYTRKYYAEDDSHILYTLMEWDTVEEGIDLLRKHLSR